MRLMHECIAYNNYNGTDNGGVYMPQALYLKRLHVHHMYIQYVNRACQCCRNDCVDGECLSGVSTDKTRWMESLATPESQREDEKIYQTWGESLQQ